MELYMKDQWCNPSHTSIFNREIFEYDMESAGLSLAIKYELLPKMVTEHLKSLPKEKRVVEMGLMERDNKKFREDLKQAFREIRKLFFESNGLEPNEIISVKKDALFTLRPCLFTDFDNVRFRVKHQYSSYLHFSNLEFYYTPENTDVKGMNPIELEFHQNHMLRLIKKFIYLNETSDRLTATKMMRQVADDYKWLKLEPEYYREFRAGGQYRLKDLNDHTEYPVFPKERLEELDITYNYLKILMKLALMAI